MVIISFNTLLEINFWLTLLGSLRLEDSSAFSPQFKLFALSRYLSSWDFSLPLIFWGTLYCLNSDMSVTAWFSTVLSNYTKSKESGGHVRTLPTTSV